MSNLGKREHPGDESHLQKSLLWDFGKNVYSQFGEDGILERILDCVEVKSKVSIEFGAWDGFHYSNTAHLWSNGWKGVLIEGVASRYEDLKRNTKEYDCVCIHAYVTPTGSSALESILQNNNISQDIGVLSIDIDGNDYWILDGLSKLRPDVIICEYNPTIPAEIDLYAEYGNYFGASVAALTRIAKDKGYRLVALTDTNCFFVLDKLCKELLVKYETSLDRIKIDKHLTYLISNYAGDYVLSRSPTYNLSMPSTERLIGPYANFPASYVCVMSQRIRKMFKKIGRKLQR